MYSKRFQIIFFSHLRGKQTRYLRGVYLCIIFESLLFFFFFSFFVMAVVLVIIPEGPGS